jgi:hypothetical protein
VKTWRSKSFIVSALALVIAATAATLSFRAAVSQRASRADVNAKPQNEDRDEQEPSPSETGTNKAMTNKRMSQEDIVRLLKEGKEKGYITGNLPSDPAELEALARTIQKDMIYQQPSEAEMGIESGRQELVLRLHPSGAWNKSTDRALAIFFDGAEWSALFRDALHAKDRDPFVHGEAIDKWRERQRVRFQESIPDYPMLGRIWDTYIDVSYQPEEISHLRDECLRVKASTSNPVALRGLDKVIAACDEALKGGLGLSLLSE